MKRLIEQSNKNKHRHFWLIKCLNCKAEICKVKFCAEATITCSKCKSKIQYQRIDNRNKTKLIARGDYINA
jgi:hypothetical protein